MVMSAGGAGTNLYGKDIYADARKTAAEQDFDSLSKTGQMLAEVLGNGKRELLSEAQVNYFANKYEYHPLILFGFFKPEDWVLPEDEARLTQKMTRYLRTLANCGATWSLLSEPALWVQIVKGSLHDKQVMELVLSDKLEAYAVDISASVRSGFLSVVEAVHISLEAAQALAHQLVQEGIRTGQVSKLQILTANELGIAALKIPEIEMAITYKGLNPGKILSIEYKKLLALRGLIKSVIQVINEEDVQSLNPALFRQCPAELYDMLLEESIAYKKARALVKFFKKHFNLSEADSGIRQSELDTVFNLNRQQIESFTYPIVKCIYNKFGADFIHSSGDDLIEGAIFVIKMVMQESLTNKLKDSYDAFSVDSYIDENEAAFLSLAKWIFDNIGALALNKDIFFYLINTPEYIKALLDIGFRAYGKAITNEFLMDPDLARKSYSLDSTKEATAGAGIIARNLIPVLLFQDLFGAEIVKPLSVHNPQGTKKANNALIVAKAYRPRMAIFEGEDPDASSISECEGSPLETRVLASTGLQDSNSSPAPSAAENVTSLVFGQVQQAPQVAEVNCGCWFAWKS